MNARYWGHTALVWAARGGHAQAARMLIEAGADANEKGGEYGQTALWWTARGGHTELARMLF